MQLEKFREVREVRAIIRAREHDAERDLPTDLRKSASRGFDDGRFGERPFDKARDGGVLGHDKKIGGERAAGNRAPAYFNRRMYPFSIVLCGIISALNPSSNRLSFRIA